GLLGAAFATSLGRTIGRLMRVGYLLRRSHTLHLQRIKLSRKSMHLTARNIGYKVKLGSSAFLTALSIGFMMFL
ncbi:MATE family efflux transporter, partial [Odoribacter splanchnicus]|nr:MATE family efflux transporter [Odoribacter splanchnicus]